MDPRELSHRISIESAGPHYQDKLQKGDPTLGWEGDPFLVLAYHRLKDEWEVWDTQAEPPVLVASRTADKFDLNSLVAGLRDMSVRRRSHAQAVEEVLAHNEAVTKALVKSAAERAAPEQEKAFWKLRKLS